MFRSRSLRTILGFSSPQQFQLNTPKEGGFRLPENPDERQQNVELKPAECEQIVGFVGCQEPLQCSVEGVGQEQETLRLYVCQERVERLDLR